MREQGWKNLESWSLSKLLPHASWFCLEIQISAHFDDVFLYLYAQISMFVLDIEMQYVDKIFKIWIQHKASELVPDNGRLEMTPLLFF